MLGPHMRRLRRMKDYNQDVVADRLGISTPSLSRWEQGLISFRIEMLAPWLDALNATPEERAVVGRLIVEGK